MEQRIKENVRKILMAYPGARYVAFKGFNGLREEQTADGRLDVLGLDAFLYLDNNSEMKVQVKCDTKENFDRWGKERQSFTLGAMNDLVMKRVIDVPIKFYDLFLTGYELTEGVLAPYTLFSWPFLVKRVAEGALDNHLEINRNQKTGQAFCWIQYEHVIAPNINLTQQYDVTAFK